MVQGEARRSGRRAGFPLLREQGRDAGWAANPRLATSDPRASADRLRTAIARACKAAGVPPFSPHDLRHRRISLLHHHGRTWAQIGEFVGQRKLSVTSDTYTHVLSDGRELDYASLLTKSL